MREVRLGGPLREGIQLHLRIPPPEPAQDNLRSQPGIATTRGMSHHLPRLAPTRDSEERMVWCDLPPPQGKLFCPTLNENCLKG